MRPEEIAAAGADTAPFADHLTAPRGLGKLAGAAHAGAAGGSRCGDVVRFAVRLDGDAVAEAGFDGSGCAALTAAASAAVELAEGSRLLAVARTTPAHLADALGGLDAAHRHAATLVADALHRAIGAAVADGAASVEAAPCRTLVAMSGGVDSTVAAQLALDAGDEVVAVTLELWSDAGTDGSASCCSPQAVTGARALAHSMGLPHFTLDLRGSFRSRVVDDFVAEYERGRTPNPCVRCNGSVRFDAMLRLAGALGARRLATGHYARIAHVDGSALLTAATDTSKDQTYMLSRLEPRELERLWFPLGELTKPQVRELAHASGSPVAAKRESQDLCFLAGTRREQFLDRHGSRAEGSAGELVDLAGAVLGRHAGHENFTVGQRRGLGIAAGEPLYVVRKDAATNRVTVGPRSALRTRSVTLVDARLHRPSADVDRVKLRYGAAPVACRVEGAAGPGRHRGLRLALADPVDGVAPGQTASLMRGDVVLGAATIAEQEIALAA